MNYPSDPMLRRNLGILAVCEDILSRDPNRTRARIAAEITRQTRGDLASPTVAGAPSELSRDASQAKPLIDYRKGE